MSDLFSTQNTKKPKYKLLSIILLIILLISCFLLWIFFVYPNNFSNKIAKTSSETSASYNHPEILELNLSDNHETHEQSIIVKGETHPDMQIFINNEKIDNHNGLFSKEIYLNDGENSIELIIKNKKGIFLKEQFNIYKKITAQQNNTAIDTQQSQKDHTQSSQTYDCDNSLAQNMLNIINEYRASQGKNTLSRNHLMDIAACNHSKWMQANQTLNHTGENGSQFYERCHALGTNCSAENIGYGSTNAQTIFNLWKESPGHNANMLGEHSQIGIAVSATYWTTVHY